MHLLQAPHFLCAPALRRPMPHRYLLNFDVTGDKGQCGLFPCVDGWRDWVLHAFRIRSENAAEQGSAVEAILAATAP